MGHGWQSLKYSLCGFQKKKSLPTLGPEVPSHFCLLLILSRAGGVSRGECPSLSHPLSPLQPPCLAWLSPDPLHAWSPLRSVVSHHVPETLPEGRNRVLATHLEQRVLYDCSVVE